MIKTIYFDLFFTLITPTYQKTYNEYSILDFSVDEWEKYAENKILYQERALGLVKSEMEIIDKIVSTLPFKISIKQKEEILAARENRMRLALQNISSEILDVLLMLKKRNIKLGLISNADIIDCKYWKDSKLFPFFDNAVFSCNVGILKPDKRIYELALNNLKAIPNECLFIGDGGSYELYGAKSVGMKTIFTEALEVKPAERKNEIIKYADYSIDHFIEILNYI